MITSSFFASPEVLWSAAAAAVGGLGGGAAKLFHLEHRIKTVEDELAETKTDTKEDLKYLRDRMDKLVEHLMENS